MLICINYVLYCLIVLTARILVGLCFLMTHYSKSDLMASLFSQAKCVFSQKHRVKILIESVEFCGSGFDCWVLRCSRVYFLGSHNLTLIINLVIFFILLLSGNLDCVSFCKCENIMWHDCCLVLGLLLFIVM